ncbi:HD domain-containing protein [Syntrophaceticus schinkii]|uniref:Metal-dependent phosphohydrolase HD sub domain protein n=1 Tax=Syntrophaceticus schinkii TaxID=499207 RepID=A0A0B7MGA7_9FIRM|nr:HD domain-containing protein [Syntrophaceticus schinkii]CEO89115.1 Metal-dependent phosphohydrolase HD sub domain protein [Syntrophaceticus schinkii]
MSRITYILALESGRFFNLIEDNNLSGAQAAKEVVYAAGILHDIGRWRQYETGEDHSVIGAELAAEILERTNFTPQEIRVITRAIREHRSQREGMSTSGSFFIARITSPGPAMNAVPRTNATSSRPWKQATWY